MRVLATIAELVGERPTWAGMHEVGLVPTMGFLHAGHLSLFRQARAENGVVVASIFVNPTQFGPGEDLSRYPRDLPRDLERLEAAGVDVVFTPAANEMYPQGYSTYVEPSGPLAARLEAASRPGHFRGVATVVLKLFQLVQPHRAYFGQKDAQQVAVIRRMVADLNLAVGLRILPTVREADGLAMSSRNSYLAPADRKAATVLYRALRAGYYALEQQPSGGGDAVARTMAEVVAREPRAALDYAEVCDPNTFEPLTSMRGAALLAVAARVGRARLIDNFVRRPDGSWDTGVRLSEESAGGMPRDNIM
jgi:pantoate--beta-alanine ligase